MTDDVTDVGTRECDLRVMVLEGPEGWEGALSEALRELALGRPELWRQLIQWVLDDDKAANGFGIFTGRLFERLVGKSAKANDHLGLDFLVSECLNRVSRGDQHAWNVLQKFTYHLLVRKCEIMLRQKVSRSNPLITRNTLAAEVFLRLNHAIFEKASVAPKTSREYFGLIARNMRWQLTDMLRRPSASSGSTSILEDIAVKSGVEVHDDSMETWTRFWEVVDMLPETQREVFDLLWIHEMSQYEAATLLGLTRDKVKDIWREVRLHIAENCAEDVPRF